MKYTLFSLVMNPHLQTNLDFADKQNIQNIDEF